MDWVRLPRLHGTHGGCLNCGVRPDEFPMDGLITVGFGEAAISKDGLSIWRETDGPDEDSIAPDMTGQMAEDMAAADPDHDWRIILYGPLSGRSYQRQEPGHWYLVEQNEGFA